MKRICNDENEGGFEQLLGQRVLLMCANYFYTGTLEAVGEADIELSSAGIVYETGPWTEKGFKDQQRLPSTSNTFVRLDAIEAYFEVS